MPNGTEPVPTGNGSIEDIVPTLLKTTSAEEEEDRLFQKMLEECEVSDNDRRQQDRYTTLCKEYEKTDLGNSRRFVTRYKHIIRYCHLLKKWYVWDGMRWEEDNRGRILTLARDTVIRIGDEAAQVSGDTARAELFKWAGSSQSYKRIRDMVSLSTIPQISVTPFDLDSNEDLLNFPNGTLEINTLELRPHRKEDMLSLVMGVEYDPNAVCPTWIDQMNVIFQGDQEKISFFQELCGYHFINDHPMQCMYIHHGDGKNGRSVVFRVLELIFNDYCGAFPTELLLHHKNKDANPRPQPELLALIKCRMLIAKETDRGRSLSESAIKKYTGGDSEQARLLHDNKMQRFQGILKINLLTNHLPRVRGTDKGIQRRLVKIPYLYEIPEECRRPFNDVVKELYAEGPGIVNWMIAGLKRVLENGRMVRLIEPVQQATDSYLRKEDTFGRFLFEECVIRPDIPDDECITPTAVQDQYKGWAEKEGEEPMGVRAIKDEMVRRFGEQQRSGKKRFYAGVRLRTDREKEEGVDLGAKQETLVCDRMTTHDSISDKVHARGSIREISKNTVTTCHTVTTPDVKKGVTTLNDRFNFVTRPFCHNYIPDIPAYKPVPKDTVGTCIFEGCTSKPAYANRNGVKWLCEEHYMWSKKVIEEYEENRPGDPP